MASCACSIRSQLSRTIGKSATRTRTTPLVLPGKGQRAGLAFARSDKVSKQRDAGASGRQAGFIAKRTTTKHVDLSGKPSRDQAERRVGHEVVFNHSKTLTEDAPVPSRWLRDLCQCPQCVDPSSKQRNFLASDIPATIEGEVVEFDDDLENVTLKWHNDIAGFGPDHVTTIPVSMLRDPIGTAFGTTAKRRHTSMQMWSASDFASSCEDVTFENYMSSDSTLEKVLQQLKQFGLAFITNVPESTDSVSQIAERIGPIRHTLYGMTWDVRSVPDATNVAYTAKDLGFHMDLLPLKEPPALQFLHCIRSSAKGGNSRFTDALRAANDLWKADGEAFETLTRIPVRFHYDHPKSHIYEQVKCVLVPWRSRGNIPSFDRPMEINWSPPFQAPFEPLLKYKGNGTYREMYKHIGRAASQWQDAAAKFNEAIHKPEGIYERLMKPGECVIFHNTRVLHARTAFEPDDAGKERWLHGAYVDADAWNSKLRVLSRKMDQGLL